MAIRKDLDDMLNNLKGSADGKPAAKKAASPVKKATSKPNKIDSMSVDDLLSTLYIDSVKKEEEPAVPEKPKKKKIVISGDLPDYEALRQAEFEKERLAAEKKAAEEAERQRIEAERKAAEEAERQRIESEKKAAEEAEKRRIEAEKKAAEEAERQRIEAEKKAAEEAEKQRIEAEKKAAEEAERQRIEAEKKTAEEAEKQRIEAEKKAAEESSAVSFEEEINVVSSSLSEFGEELTVDELMEAAIAAVKGESEAPAPEADEEAADPVGSMIDTIREDAEKTISDIKNSDASDDDTADEESADADSDEESIADKDAERKKRFFSRKKKNDDEAETDEAPEAERAAEKPKGRLTSALEKIMEEDPDEIIEQRSEKTEADEDEAAEGGGFKKRLYTVLGVVFAVLACIGLITVIAKSVSFFGDYASGDSKKEGFADIVYPAVIMDIESFDDPSQLTSDQVITAAIWSMIMSDNVMDQYEKTFDVVRVPAVDVESYAVKLFGDSLPALSHTTVGPAESRFYYNEESKSYNIPITPVTFTYAPEIKSVTKNGSSYTVVVDYIDELPEWLPETSSKTVEFKLAEVNGGYQIKSMKVLSAVNNL